MLSDIARQDWENGSARCLSRGRAGNACVWRVERPGGAVVVKDFRRCPWWIRWTWGRWMAGHEFRLMRLLEGLPGVPGGVRRVDAYAIAMECLPGLSLGDLNAANQTAGAAGRSLPPVFFRRLERLACAMHRRGVTHLDMRNAKNVIVMPGDRPGLIDFQAGVALRRWFPRCVARLLKLADLSSVYKHYYRFYYDGRGGFADGAGGFPPSRARLFLAHLRLRRLWVLKGYALFARRQPKDYERALAARVAEGGR